MSLLHTLEVMARRPLDAIQAEQRDWSPFVAHFTSWEAMKPLHSAVTDGKPLGELRNLLENADQLSFKVMESISTDRRLRATGGHTRLSRVCFSECTLPGLLAHAERYGRYGLVFKKEDLVTAGARPCVYLTPRDFDYLASLPTNPQLAELRALANVYRPPVLVGEETDPTRRKPQDFTHEREWRCFSDVQIDHFQPVALVVPGTRDVKPVRRLFPGVEVVLPLKMMFRWGV